MSIRNCIERVINDWPTEKSKPFKGNELAEFIRTVFTNEVREIVGSINPMLKVKASSGAGNWASVPWLAILDPKITDSTEDGVYPVYFFRADGTGGYLSLGQGTTTPTKLLGKKRARIRAQVMAADLRKQIPLLNKWIEGKTYLRTETNLGGSYEDANIGARLYEKGQVPSEEVLREDLADILSIYQEVVNIWPSKGLVNTPLQKMVKAFRQDFPDFKTFGDCGQDFLKNEDGYKRKAVSLFSELFNDWLDGAPDSLEASDFSAKILKIFRKTNLLDWRTVDKIDGNILKSAKLLPQFQTLCHSLLVKARSGKMLDSELESLVGFMVQKGKAPRAATQMIPSYLLMLAKPTKYIFIKPTLVDAFFQRLGHGDLLGQPWLTAEAYGKVLGLFVNVQSQLAELGPRDMIDLQSFYYVVVGYGQKGAVMLPEPEGSVEKSVDYSKVFPEIVPAFATAISESGFCIGNNLPLRFISSLTAKPYVVLTGNSGTGKTKLAELFPRWLSCEANDRLALVPVGADWTDSRNVLGFVNHIRSTKPVGETVDVPLYQSTVILDLLLAARTQPSQPFFLILDEMNLSHVERYFADFLSTMESAKGELLLHCEGRLLPRKLGGAADVPEVLPMPRNVFVVGTVNVDETTYMFSPKVLDRANVIEFRITKDEVNKFFEQGGGNIGELESAPEGTAEAFLELSLRARGVRRADDSEREPLAAPAKLAECQEKLKEVFEILSNARLEFGYRTLNEVLRYARVDFELTEDKTKWKWEDCMDAQILQKILPKLHGSKRRIETVLIELARYCETGLLHEEKSVYASDFMVTPKVKRVPRPKKSEGDTIPGPDTVVFRESYEKLCDMIDAVRRDQFVSFIQ